MEVAVGVSLVVDDEEGFDVDEKIDASFEDADDALLASDATTTAAAAQRRHLTHLSVHFRQRLLAL